MQQNHSVTFNTKAFKIGIIAAALTSVGGFIAGNATFEWLVPAALFFAAIGAGVFWPPSDPQAPNAADA